MSDGGDRSQPQPPIGSLVFRLHPHPATGRLLSNCTQLIVYVYVKPIGAPQVKYYIKVQGLTVRCDNALPPTKRQSSRAAP